VVVVPAALVTFRRWATVVVAVVLNVVLVVVAVVVRDVGAGRLRRGVVAAAAW